MIEYFPFNYLLITLFICVLQIIHSFAHTNNFFVVVGNHTSVLIGLCGIFTVDDEDDCECALFFFLSSSVDFRLFVNCKLFNLK